MGGHNYSLLVYILGGLYIYIILTQPRATQLGPRLVLLSVLIFWDLGQPYTADNPTIAFQGKQDLIQLKIKLK